jgi:hypothetical protein
MLDLPVTMVARSIKPNPGANCKGEEGSFEEWFQIRVESNTISYEMKFTLLCL